MSYIRVIPRDLFNEASLLKCLGKLYILVENTTDRSAKFDVEDVPAFEIQQDENDGSIYVANLPFSVSGRRVHLSRPLNSREPWPLYLSLPEDPDFDTIAVFDETGNLSPDIHSLIEWAAIMKDSPDA